MQQALREVPNSVGDFETLRAIYASMGDASSSRDSTRNVQRHGPVSGDLDGLAQPALALSNPNAVGGSCDGLLKMDDVLALKLDADWVVLSACNTAAADGAGSEAVSGLGRARC
jgi:hypothetical protein